MEDLTDVVRGKIFKGFKGGCYIVETLCRDFLTDRLMVVVRVLNDKNRVYVFDYIYFSRCFEKVTAVCDVNEIPAVIGEEEK